MRALTIAEAANPEWTSVPLVGYSHARALLDVTEGHIVTQVRNVEALERAGLRHGVDFTAIDSEVVAKPLWQVNAALRKATGLGWSFETAMGVLPYYYFERKLWERFGEEIAGHRWDVVHRITPLSPTAPSSIAGACKRHGVPFIVGPLNGGVPWPKGYGSVQHREGEWLHYVRGAYRLLPGYSDTLNNAAAVIVGSVATLEQLPDKVRERAVYVPENAIDPAKFGHEKTAPIELPLRVAFVGRLVAYKGADMLMQAAAPLMRAGKVVLDIIGDGPEMFALRQLAAELQCQDQVKLEGWVPHKELPARLQQSDVFGFPSIREFGGGAVLEAMALGLVPIIADYAGPAELVTQSTGFKVAMGPREDLILGVRRALEILVTDPASVRPMGQRARARVFSHFTWQRKAQQMLEVYKWALGVGPKPDFGMPFADVPTHDHEVGMPFGRA